MAARSRSRQRQITMGWSGTCCYVEGEKSSSFPENQLRGNERGTGRITVRFKAALPPRDDNGALCSVTKEGCGWTQSPPSHPRGPWKPSSLQSHRAQHGEQE